jgi:hypothetical protein
MARSRREFSADETIRRGQHASQILGDEVFKDAVEFARESFYEDWLATSDERDQYAAWAKTHGLEAVEKELRGIISDGEVAASRRGEED